MEGAIGVLLADDDATFRTAVRSALAGEGDIAVVGEAGDGREAIEAARALSPDVVLLDLRLPVMDGIEAAAEMHRASPASRVVMLTVSDDGDDVRDALEAGASGYLLKSSALADLAPALRAVTGGLGLLVAPEVASALVTGDQPRPPGDQSRPAGVG